MIDLLLLLLTRLSWCSIRSALHSRFYHGDNKIEYYLQISLKEDLKCCRFLNDPIRCNTNEYKLCTITVEALCNNVCFSLPLDDSLGR
jgi:hypothetical protein